MAPLFCGGMLPGPRVFPWSLYKMVAMLLFLERIVDNLAVNLRAADVLDIVLIAGFAYVILAWLRQRVSQVVGFGLVLVGVVYALAEAFDLYLTSMMFQVGLTVIALALVVVFQDDIRRLFERIRTTRLWGAEHGPRGEHPELDTLVEGADVLSQKRVGALMVLGGKEALEVHLHGGIKAHAELSVPMLLSIFHPETAGHDGAVVIEGGQIDKFSVHLPLSTNQKELGAGGTRHAAALGLAERCDALVVVVSEERGTISVAREGRLEVLDSAGQLRGRLEQFFERETGPTGLSRWRRWLTHNLGLKAASVAMAAVLWVSFAYRVETVQRTYEVPVEYRGLPDAWALSDTKPMKAHVDLSGSERVFDRIKSSDLKIALDLSRIEPGVQTFRLNEGHLNEPEGVEVSDFDPRVIRLEAHRMVQAKLPINVATKGEVAAGSTLAKIVVEPSRLEVLLPEHLARYFTQIPTEPIDLGGLNQSRTVTTGVRLPDSVRLKGQKTAKIKVRLVVEANKAPSSHPARAPDGTAVDGT